MKRSLLGVTLSLLVCSQAIAADIYGLTKGTPELKSAGPMTFGPDGILFIGDPKAATVYAIQTGEKKGNAAEAAPQIDGVNEAINQKLKGEATIADMAVSPATGNVFFLVTVKGSGPALVRVSGGEVSKVPLKDIAFSKKVLTSAPDDAVVGQGRRRRNLRDDSITDIAWVDSDVIVSGLRKGDSPSGVTTMVFPFNNADKGAGLEIYHAAHGKSEDYSAIRTFVPFIINGEANLLAGFVCTPLVKFPVSAVESSGKVTGTTIAELGNRNRPLDMIVYEKGGKNFLLLSNSARGVMKISTEDIERSTGITEPVRGGGAAGQEYETIESWKNVVQLDKLNDTHAAVLIKNGDQLDLKTVELP
ncbi:hypothetical protein OAF98_04895 [Planctomicrobium sp.]|jgi:hypothetical protein|nr:hypothetical protein [Planctomicrobium sp.]MDA7527367.1 hypothetical protein [bacterium]MDB4733142.1 hypothetical protein [Planctomicrobium sp.]MDB4743804.1 hypothetical protein [Planctomicrobium sp.]